MWTVMAKFNEIIAQTEDLRDITTFIAHVTGCDIEKSFVTTPIVGLFVIPRLRLNIYKTSSCGLS